MKIAKAAAQPRLGGYDAETRSGAGF